MSETQKEIKEKSADPLGSSAATGYAPPKDEQMCCLSCGFVQPLSHPGYETEYPDGDDGDEFPICPVCGEWNVGGCQSFAEWMVWGQDERDVISSKA